MVFSYRIQHTFFVIKMPSCTLYNISFNILSLIILPKSKNIYIMYTELSMHVNDSVQDTMLSTWVSVGSFVVGIKLKIMTCVNIIFLG